MRKPDHPIFKIYLQGTAAIPALVRLSTSRKLTPAIQQAIMNSSEKRLRLGHLASAILEDMTSTLAPGYPRGGSFRFHSIDNHWAPWLVKTDLTDEKSFFLKALGNSKIQKQLPRIPLKILFNKFPETAIPLAEKFSTSQHDGTFIETLMKSTIQKSTKIRALKLVSQKQKGFDRSYMIQSLAKLDQAAAEQALMPLIAALPKDLKRPYWTAPEPRLTYIVCSLENPSIWKAYLTKVKASAIGLRLEMLHPMGQVRTNEKVKHLRLAFLSNFLADTEIRKVKHGDPRWEGPHAGFTYDKLSVQNLAAEKIASILEIPGEPADYWTKKQWTPYRKKVEAALSKLTLPDLTHDN